MSTLKEMLGKKATNVSDQTIANDSMAGKAAGASAYFAAAMKATTPELKQLFSANATQMFGEHTALTELSINKGWMDPYTMPEDQLLQTFNHSKEVLESHISQ